MGAVSLCTSRGELLSFGSIVSTLNQASLDLCWWRIKFQVINRLGLGSLRRPVIRSTIKSSATSSSTTASIEYHEPSKLLECIAGLSNPSASLTASGSPIRSMAIAITVSSGTIDQRSYIVRILSAAGVPAFTAALNISGRNVECQSVRLVGAECPFRHLVDRRKQFSDSILQVSLIGLIASAATAAAIVVHRHSLKRTLMSARATGHQRLLRMPDANWPPYTPLVTPLNQETKFRSGRNGSLPLPSRS